MAYKLKIPVLRGGVTIPIGAVIELSYEDAQAIDCEETDAPLTAEYADGAADGTSDEKPSEKSTSKGAAKG